MKLHLTMFSFECTNNDNCHNMMYSPDKTNAYVTHGLTKFLEFIEENGYKDHVSAIEMLNEPEWMIDGG